ncbi:hypothetical protein PIB30_104451, partial [Stylosanthes scabra]|nr:hypothetical protein [Stylosanthes scabra]
KKAGIQRCNALLKNRQEFKRVRRMVKADEKNVISPTLKCSTVMKNKPKKKKLKPLNEAFQNLERTDMDLKVMKALWTNGIPFNVLRNPHFIEMGSAINNGPKIHKPPTFDKARTILLDECKRSV